MNTTGNVASDPVNVPSEKPVRTRSRFPSLSYHLFNTERFGEYNSCFVMDCVAGDKVPIRSGGTVHSYSLKAPLMQSIFKKKDFYMVPMEAILPINWQKFYTNPVIGDDVSDDVGTGVSNFWHHVWSIADYTISNVRSILADVNASNLDKLNAVVRGAVLMEYFYSSGSLIKTLGASGNRFFFYRYSNQKVSFDTWFDLLMSAVVNLLPYFEFRHDGQVSTVINDEVNEGYRRTSAAVVSFRTFLQFLRDDLTTHFSNYGSVTAAQITAALSPFFDNSVWAAQIANAELDYDLRRLWAYQLVVSHFYSNDHVDYIYSAELFRSLVSYLVYTDSSGNYVPSVFTCNGIKYEFDATSGHCWYLMQVHYITALPSILKVRNGTTTSDDYYRNVLAYFSTLLSYRRSLRFVDYFTGSRTRPLAVGDVNVNVNSNLVNVVDVSRNIQRQRFFNAVNRFGRRFEEYIKGLTGITPDTDWHNPLYLAHTSDSVYGVQTENTGVAQQSQGNSITSRFMSNGSRYQFEFEVDRPCVVIGLSYYDIPRAYIFATERPLFHMNRFDMFNPYMQFIGDQDVKFAELGAGYVSANTGVFGYQLRHMEYKQRYDQAAGAFVDDLPGFLFTDKEFGDLGFYFQNPDFIRSLNSELDSFYVALTGYSLGHYFHFIVDNDNVCDASRPMAYAPSIL